MPPNISQTRVTLYIFIYIHNVNLKRKDKEEDCNVILHNFSTLPSKDITIFFRLKKKSNEITALTVEICFNNISESNVSTVRHRRVNAGQ